MQSLSTKPEIANWPIQQKLAAAIQHSAKYLAPGLADQLRALITPENLALMAASMAVWSAAQFLVIGEIADAIGLVALALGAISLGPAVFSIAKRTLIFADHVTNARTEADLEAAGFEFAYLLSQIGTVALLSLLAGKILPGIFKLHPALEVDQIPGMEFNKNAPDTGFIGRYRPQTHFEDLSHIKRHGGSLLGATTLNGDIVIEQSLPEASREFAYWHESVHRFLTPKLYRLGSLQLGWLRTARVYAYANGYARSCLLRYLEEMLAQLFASVKMAHIADWPQALSFPVAEGYVSLRQLGTEAVGVLVGSIALSRTTYLVYFAAKAEFRALLKKRPKKTANMRGLIK